MGVQKSNMGLLTFEGAIPPLAEIQSQLWIMNLLGALPRPIRAEDDDYLLRLEKGRRLKYIVDHESYA